MIFKLFVIFLLLFGSLEYGHARNSSTDSFRCRNSNLVKRGDYQHEVLKKCGNPTSKAEYSLATLNAVWVYDIGPGRYTYFLTFYNSKLQNIEGKAKW